MASFSFPDRVEMKVAGVVVFPDGEISNLSIDSSYNAVLVNGMSTDLRASGDVVGNANFGFSVTVNYTPNSASQKINFELLFNRTARPPVTITPFDPNHTQSGTVWTLLGVRLNGSPRSAPGQGQNITTTYSFIAKDYIES
jgi:hypothetical protein